ncbi:sugar phosphate isomerase/epimerase [Zhouia spongiae]|uniref:Sugar phosphate isomerase/epimerase n=1 Tax=Zhouia spongiae TaxID=2202721 RepID=A0ABY3YP58_9FLAO|nr:sugar phosphate isomerase/epimerase family protein [Zhouia spongiae]UNY99476.1 sugar phosphate isomerase/epimerase [Zhouia spongiae]
MKRRIFLKNTSQFGIALSVLGLASCAENNKKKNAENPENITGSKEPFFKLSLAQWSVHRMIHKNELNPLDFAKIAGEWGFSGLEFVNHLYNKELDKNTNLALSVNKLTTELNKRSKDNNVTNLIMMVDLPGDIGSLASGDEAKRKVAIESHQVWADASAALGCHSMRVNLHGNSNLEEWTNFSAESLATLSEYASKSNLNIIVENHGGFSSNGQYLSDVMKRVNMSNCGTLPDFGNFCIKKEDGKCTDEYDRYTGLKELLPFAKGVSAKSYDFDAEGNETTIDYKKALQLVKATGYSGFVGVEYEGDRLSEEEGIKATRDLLIRIGSELA